MKLHATEISSGKTTKKKLFLLAIFLIFLTIIPLFLLKNPHSPLPSPRVDSTSTSELRYRKEVKECDLFTGKWVPFPKGPPYYSNETCNMIIDQQNCLKFGRPDKEFMKWRWRPEECELPLFSAVKFLELVRGKSMAFVGDSVGRNQMQSLLCLLATAAQPKDVSHLYTSDATYFRYWFYSDYKFTLATLWSPFLVKSSDADPNGHSLNSLMNLYLDQADDVWASKIESFDYVIISAGQWFFRPLLYYMNGQIVGCHNCYKDNITDVTKYYGYRMAFRTAFKTLQELKGFKGMTFLRTFSPSHFENGAWNAGGNCVRTRPYTSEEVKFDGYNLEFYLTQIEELKKAEKEGKKKGLNFGLLATTEAMLLRPDGHPNQYGRSLLHKNVTVNDCVHWCLPGPIDTWNEFLLYMMKREALRSSHGEMQNIT
ncbi:protein trichome birefringence-like 19 [Euphorbia lathyris]|uniref:protein trichome birefringence-like 19 n=1 Tax=Euphorbia lathyris TaxID=212925 RepID=UPI0033139528